MPGWYLKQARPGPKPKPKLPRRSISANITRGRWRGSPVPQPVVQLPGERDEMRYLPLGVGVVIPPWNFALAILCGMTVAALVTGNTVVIKPSSETPTIAAIFAETLLEAGFPARVFLLPDGQRRRRSATLLVSHPKTRFVSFTGSRDVGLHINELAAKAQPGQIWIKRVVAEMGGKDAIIVDGDCDLDAAVEGVAVSAFGYQGQKCSACSRAIVHADVYDEFRGKLKAARREDRAWARRTIPRITWARSSARARRRPFCTYIEVGKRRRPPADRAATTAEGDGYFIPPTVIADVDSKARIFQEEIFGPVLAVAKARDFDACARDGERFGVWPDRRDLFEQRRARAARAR